ncbi:MAG: hypothetical protein JXX28_04235 [Deltaproteobacteria bacterium]|nr:hypothetical protein [Deltaproteobacteria bacterium]
MIRAATPLLSLFALTGCPFDKEEEALGGDPCTAVVTEVSLDDATLGFSARDLLDMFEGTHQSPLRYVSGDADTIVTLTLAGSGVARLVVQEPVEGESLLYADCPDYLELPLSLTVSTADGALDEVFAVDAAAISATELELFAEVELSALNGSLSVEVPQDADRSSVQVEANFNSGGSGGVIRAQHEGAEDCEGSDSTAWASSEELASWPAVVEG